MRAAGRIHPNYRCRRCANCVLRVLGTTGLVPVARNVVGFVTAMTALFLPAVKMAEFYEGRLWATIQPVGDLLYEHRADGAFLLLLILTILNFLIWLLGRYKQIDRPKIERTLNELADRHFAKTDDENHHYRVTLFKARKLPLVGSWLGMVARSGDKFRRLRTIFSIDAEDRSRNTSLAGECFWQGATIIRRVDPLDESKDGEELAKAIQTYIKASFISQEEFDTMAAKSCVFLITCIKLNGKKWGVLVLDSSDPEAYPSDKARKAAQADLEYSAALLSELLR
jgi:hypothetical protein